MKLGTTQYGGYSFKRKYSIAQIIVDIASIIALIYIIFMVYAYAVDIETTKSLNSTESSLDFLNWEPLIIWCILGVVIIALSVLAILLPRKAPKKILVTENNAPKYCNIIDTGISCLRLVILHSLSELCYIHMQSIMLQEVSLSIQLIFDLIIVALIVWLSAVRIDSVNQVAISEAEEKKTHKIIEN